MSFEIVGPGKLPCEQGCEVPEGVTMVGVPTPRHAWTDVLVCPNDGCGRAWMIVRTQHETTHEVADVQSQSQNRPVSPTSGAPARCGPRKHAEAQPVGVPPGPDDRDSAVGRVVVMQGLPTATAHATSHATQPRPHTEDTMTWTQFWDMHSGGGLKEDPYHHIYIEAPEDEARVIFYNRFEHNPSRVSCTCCGDDYSISEEPTLAQVTGYERHCDSLETPRVDGRYKQPDDPWFKEHYYLEPGEEDEARRRGYGVRENTAKQVGRRYGSDFGRYLTVDEYIAQPDVLVIRADEIKDEERHGSVPEQGYVWAG